MRKLLIFIIALLIIAPIFWYQTETAAVNKNDTTAFMFIVHKGEGVNSIASRLKEQNLIKSARAFELLVRLENLTNKIQAGEFRLSKSMSSETIAKDLTHGSLDIWVTIPEGKRAEEIAQMLQEKMPLYEDSWKQTLQSNEGYLFPDTYLLQREATIDQIIQTMRSNFDKHYQQAASSITTSLTQEQVVILASLIEREGKTDSDRPLIASVFYNRLKLGMPLQIDATVQYALGYNNNEQTWWKNDLTTEDLQFVSPYNTYINVGLPPAPICNPGQKALEAALNPAQTDYLFYLADKTGQTHFAKTLQEHNANIKKYGL